MRAFKLFKSMGGEETQKQSYILCTSLYKRLEDDYTCFESYFGTQYSFQAQFNSICIKENKKEKKKVEFST